MINICLVSWWIAYGMAIYCVASLYYYYKTRSLGTPFKDSLTKEQLRIRNEATVLRKRIFCEGLAVGLLAMIIVRPFSTR